MTCIYYRLWFNVGCPPYIWSFVVPLFWIAYVDFQTKQRGACLAHAFRKLDMLGCSQASLVHLVHIEHTALLWTAHLVQLYMYYICLIVDKDFQRNPFNSWRFFFLLRHLEGNLSHFTINQSTTATPPLGRAPIAELRTHRTTTELKTMPMAAWWENQRH